MSQRTWEKLTPASDRRGGPERSNGAEPDRRSGIERRGAVRFPAVPRNVAEFRWSVGPEFRILEATLDNISYSGALAIVTARPPADAAIEFRMVRPNVTDWTQIQIVKITLAPGRTFQVRLTFPDSCPYSFFNSAVEGFDTLV